MRLIVNDHPWACIGSFSNARVISEDTPEDPEDLPSEDSILSLDECLDMNAAVEHRTGNGISY